MFETYGADPGELGDIDVISHDDTIHLFHLVLPCHDLVAHLTSRDGFNWKQAPPALRTGDPGDCDDDMIWTMHTVARPDGKGFHMYYTGCALAEHGQVQRVALATSPDLVHWTKHARNPVLESAPPHYHHDRNVVGFLSFRDPFVFIEDGVWHMFVAGRTLHGPRFRRGCVTHATSRDGITWEQQAPLLAPGMFEDMEVPAVLKMDGRYYLFIHDFAGHSLYRVADKLTGPWRAPLRDMLLPTLNAVFRFCQWKGKTLLFHWLRGAETDWKRRAPGKGVACVPAPKEVVVQENGELALRSFSGWAEHYTGTPRVVLGAELAQTVSGQHLHWCAGDFDHFVLETELRLDSGRAMGLMFRSDANIEVLNWIRFDMERQAIELHKYIVRDSSLNRFKLRKTLLQEIPVKIEYGKPVRVRLLACGPYIEVSVNEVVHLCAATYAAKQGWLGAFIEDGAGKIGELRVQGLRVPWEAGK